MVNVVVTRPRTIQVSSNGTAGIIDSTKSVTLKQNPISFINRLDNLVDVDPSGEANNATLVYDAETDTYVVRQINLDGGNF